MRLRGGTRANRRAWLYRTVVASAVVVVIILGTLALPLPAFVLRPLVLSCQSWILTDYAADVETSSPLDRGVRKLVATFLEQKLVEHVRSDFDVPSNATDVERLLTVLFKVKPLILNVAEVPHEPSSWPTLLSGVGYCDQLNGVAARVLAGFFPVSQIFALYDPVKHLSPHTIGRVWSTQERDWLYYDIYFDDVRIFRLDDKGGVRFVAAGRPVPLRETPPPAAGLYEMAREGWVLNEYRPTFLSYLLLKAEVAVGMISRPAQPPLVEPTEERPSQPMVSLGSASRDYLDARLTHLLDGEERALRAYTRLVRVHGGNDDPSKETAVRAAEGFIVTLAGQGHNAEAACFRIGSRNVRSSRAPAHLSIMDEMSCAPDGVAGSVDEWTRRTKRHGMTRNLHGTLPLVGPNRRSNGSVS